MLYLYAAVAVLLAYPVGRAATAVIRWSVASRSTKRNSLTALRVRWSWRWTTRNLGLAIVDRHRTDELKASGRRGQAFIYPKRRIRADRYGLVVKVKTAPGVSELEWQKAAPQLAHAWRVRRVQVSVAKPGRLVVRAVRRDPLAEPLGLDAVPADAYSSPSRLYVGRDALARHRWLDIAGVPGVLVAGLPGYGKSSLLNGWLYGLIDSPAVAVSIIDGKGGTDFSHVRDRCSIYTGDHLDHALEAFELLYKVLGYRQANMRRMVGSANFWHAGPTPELPLQLVIVDEAHGFFDERSAVTKDDKAKVQRLTYLVTQLIKKGRSAGFCVVLASQKVTADSIPTAIRDVCSAYLSFAVRTRESAVAALGPDITEYPDLSPVGLLDRSQYVGVATAALGDSDLEPFCQLRTPYVPDDSVALRARQSVQHKPPDTEYLMARHWSPDGTTARVPAAA